MASYFITGSLYSTQQLGVTVVVDGEFAVVYLLVMLAIIIAVLLGWGLWRYIKAKQGSLRKPLSSFGRGLIFLFSMYPIWFGLR